uniref:uncharacterized J domain-containing protein C17A3.05c-like n=1 Tax=Fragaria vesca subsp. vesca TaxID=101020 RepID=UPI0005CB4F61|nr:PREDICTED: uncharacterized J domain-containing protein C17A3.05c-like [Fragaria vesca subsp. vesca]
MQNWKEKKKVESDHYRVLDLPSGKEGTKLNEKQITKAYRRLALQLHPDKRPNDPDANAKFQRLQSSYAVLMDPHARKVFDASLIRLDNKPSSSKPKTQASSSSGPKRTSYKPKKKKDEPSGFDMACSFMLILGSQMFRASVRQALFAGPGPGLCLLLSLGSLVLVDYLERYLERDPVDGAATNQEPESRQDDDEDIDEDWVMV